MIGRIVRALTGRTDAAPATPELFRPDFTSDRAREYHESNRFGR